MSADIQPLTPASGAADRQVPGATGGGSVYLDAYLAPFRQWLDRDTVTEIIVNRPGEVWIEDAAIPGGMQRIETDAITDMLVQRLARVSTASIRCSARRCQMARACSFADRPQPASTG